MAFNILTLDGGGIRGVFTARLLERLNEVPALKGFLNEFMLISGTSTGGILALGLAAGLSPSRLVKLYKDNGSAIFDSPWHRGMTTLGGLSGPKYRNDGLRKTLLSVFGESTLGSLQRHVLLPAFDLDNYDGSDGNALSGPRMAKAKFFTNFEGSVDANYKIVDAAMATSAAPTFFPAHNGFVDGGVVANNPVMCAVAEAIKRGHPLSSLKVLSVGTGHSPYFIKDKENAGLIGWGGEISSMWLDGVSGVHAHIAEYVLGTRGFRLNGALPVNIPLDDVKQVDKLLAAADSVDLSGVIRWLAPQR